MDKWHESLGALAEAPPASETGRKFSTHISGLWNAGSKPNGGYIMALGAKAMSMTLPYPDPLTVTCHFLSAADEDEAEVCVERVRVGRSLATAAACVSQTKDRARLIGTFGSYADSFGPTHVSVRIPEMPAPEECVPAARRLPTGVILPVVDHVDIRYPPQTTLAAEGRVSGRAEVSAWFRMRDECEPDPFMLFFAADAFAPAVLELGLRGWSPTIELTVHIRGAPRPGWLRIHRRTQALVNGYFEEDTNIWDSGGSLVAQGRQFARLGAPLPEFS